MFSSVFPSGALAGVRCEVFAANAWAAGRVLRAADCADGVRAKFRLCVLHSEPLVFLNFDLTPFASTQDLPTTNHMEPEESRVFINSGYLCDHTHFLTIPSGHAF